MASSIVEYPATVLDTSSVYGYHVHSELTVSERVIGPSCAALRSRQLTRCTSNSSPPGSARASAARPWQGLADIARHVSQRTLNPPQLIQTAFSDVADIMARRILPATSSNAPCTLVS